MFTTWTCTLPSSRSGSKAPSPQRRVVFSTEDFAALRRGLFTDDGKENAAFLACGTSATPKSTTFLVRDVIPVPPSEYADRQDYHLEITPRFVNSLIDRYAGKGFGLIAVHSHPGSEVARYSSSDDFGERRLLSVLTDLLGPARTASLLFADNHIVGRALSHRGFEPLNDLVTVGPRLSFTPLTMQSKSPVGPMNGVQSRQVLVFGQKGQALLKQLTVGVVGLGGTGSAVVEQLVRLGVENFVFIDPDHFEASNLSRLYGSRFKDTKGRHLPKVDIAFRLCQEVNPTVKATLITESVVRQPVLLQLRDCDVVFSCTDNDWSRSVLNRFAYQYLVSLIDLGTRVGTREGLVVGIGGRVARIGPDTACLRCAHHLDPERIRIEAMPAALRESLMREHYIEGIAIPAPSVISFNTTVASLAVSELLALALGIGNEDRANELIYDGLEGIAFRARPEKEPRCDICGHSGVKAIGDQQVVSAYE